jgi:hypothetical protein
VTRIVLLCWLGLAQLSCNAILGIEQAHVDPRLSPAQGKVDAATEDEVLHVTDAGQDGSVWDAATPGNPPNVLDGDASGEVTATELSLSDGGGATGQSPPTDDSLPEADAGEAPTATASTSSLPPEETVTDELPSDLDGGAELGLDSGLTPEPTVCEKYCEEVMELCSGALEQYRDMRQCLTVCEYFPEGQIESDENENTAACRLRFASKARYASGTELEAYCRQAGPGGDGRCGSNCDGFCTVMQGVCTDEAADIYHFNDVAACLSACEQLPVSAETYSTANPNISDGDHVQCRLFHVTSAAMLDAEEHCEHAMGLTLCEAPAEEAVPAP